MTRLDIIEGKSVWGKLRDSAICINMDHLEALTELTFYACLAGRWLIPVAYKM